MCFSFNVTNFPKATILQWRFREIATLRDLTSTSMTYLFIMPTTVIL